MKSLNISAQCWKEVIGKIPTACVDVIIQRGNMILLGWRSIPPYRNLWALPGGRIRFGDTFKEAAIDQAAEISLKVKEMNFVGIYPIKFKFRHDISICMCCKHRLGIPRPTKELTRFRWVATRELESMKSIGGNYRKMLRDWLKKQESSAH